MTESKKITNADTDLTPEQRSQIDQFLKGYGINRKLLRLDRYEKEFFGYRPEREPDGDMLNEAPLSRARMFRVRHFILSLDNSDEKLFLYYHYIRGESVERTSELLGLSRRSGFRMKRRALRAAYKKLVNEE